MPTPDRTSLEQIVTAARDLIEAEGLAALTMQAVAARVGVRAPSLYKRVDSRDGLVRLVAEQTARELGDAVTTPTQDALGTGDPDVRAELARVLGAFRAFARTHPGTYQLIFTPHSEQAAADPAVLAATSAPVLDIAARLAGDENALDAARTITAWAHGFVTMERSGGFRLGGDLEQAWAFGMECLVQAMDPAAPAAR